MKANLLAVVAICILAGVATSCVKVHHTMLGPVDYPQVVNGKVQWSVSDKNSYDIHFTGDSPCKEGALLHVVPGKVTTCTVVKKGLFYPYDISQKSSATITAHRAVIVPCRACGQFEIALDRTSPDSVSIGALVGLSSTPTTTVYEYACAQTGNDACVYQGQAIEWQLAGDGTQLEVDFPPANTPCAEGATLKGSSTSKPFLPLTCTTATGGGATKTYKYTFKVNGGSSLDNGSTVTVKAAP